MEAMEQDIGSMRRWIIQLLSNDTIIYTQLFCLSLYLILQQEDIEEAARAELWREELIEEIEQKVGGLRELEEAGKK